MAGKVGSIDQPIDVNFDEKKAFSAWQQLEHNEKTNSNAYLYDFPQHVKVDYDSAFIEPAAYSDRGLGKYMSKPLNWIFGLVFEYTQTGFFYVLSAIVGIFLSVLWAIVFGLFSFFLVWFLQPTFKLVYIQLRIVGALLRPAIRITLDPLFESCGLLFSSIHGKFTLSMFGLDRIIRELGTTEKLAIQEV